MSPEPKPRQGARPWGGLVPAGLEPHAPPAAPQAPTGGAEGAPPVPVERSLEDRVAARIDDCYAALCELRDRPTLPPELLGIPFDGKAQLLRQRDDHVAPALSYGVYNPTDVPVFVAFSGGEPTAAGGALEVPSPGWIVVPVLVGTVMLGADPTALEEEAIMVWRLRFPTVQPFDMGAL